MENIVNKDNRLASTLTDKNVCETEREDVKANHTNNIVNDMQSSTITNNKNDQKALPV